MKYMIEWTARSAGLTYEQNFAGLEALQTAFAKWKPEEGLNVLAFVASVSPRKGYVLVEAGDPKVVASFVSKYGFWLDIEVTPVIDIGDAVAISGANINWARTASQKR